MKSLLSRLRNGLPTGYLSGLGFGLVTFVSCALVLTFLYWALRPFVWAAVYGVAYEAPPGPYAPHSGEWLFVQLIWLASGVALGCTVNALSGTKTRSVLLTLAFLWVALAVVGEPGKVAEGWRLALQYLQVPLGVLLGVLLRPGFQFKSISQNPKPTSVHPGDA